MTRTQTQKIPLDTNCSSWKIMHTHPLLRSHLAVRSLENLKTHPRTPKLSHTSLTPLTLLSSHPSPSVFPRLLVWQATESDGRGRFRNVWAEPQGEPSRIPKKMSKAAGSRQKEEKPFCLNRSQWRRLCMTQYDSKYDNHFHYSQW